MSNDRNDRGQFVKRVPLSAVLDLLVRANEPLTGTEVGDELDISNRAALNKLNELHERGSVERKQVGASAVVWWCEDEIETLSAAGSPSMSEFFEVRDNDGEHDPNGPFFSAPIFGEEDGEPIEVADTDEILGDALVDEWADE